MSPIGKFFIVLNLFLSAAFVGWAANALSKTEDYKGQLKSAKEANEKALAAKEEELSKLQLDLSGVTDQQRQFREQRDGLEAEANRLKTQVEELKRASDLMQANLTKIQATLGDYNNSIAQLTQQKDAAVERAHEAERGRDAALAEKDAAMLAQRDAEEATGNSARRIADLEAERSSLAAEKETLETRMQMIVKTYDVDLTKVVAQPQIEAMVLDVNKDLKLVILNKGKKDDVKVGYTFSIYRGSQFKGQVRIQDVQEGMSSALILNEKNAIGRGDSATTLL